MAEEEFTIHGGVRVRVINERMFWAKYRATVILGMDERRRYIKSGVGPHQRYGRTPEIALMRLEKKLQKVDNKIAKWNARVDRKEAKAFAALKRAKEGRE